MKFPGQNAFLALILAQAVHSVEECVTRLYEVFAPARLVGGLFGADPALGFPIANAIFVAFGLWCWAVPIRSGCKTARGLMWFWTILELGNGLNHLILAVTHGGYFPGAGTAPLLVSLAAYLGVTRLRVERRSPATFRRHS